MENDQATLNEPAEEVSMEDSIRESLNEIRARDDVPEEVELTEPAEPEKAARVRTPNGKFAKTEVVESEPVALAEAEPIEVAKPETTSAPSSWKNTAKAKFATLDPEIQQEVLRRESDFHKGTEQYKQAASFGQEMHRALTPYSQTLQQLQNNGISASAAISGLLNTDHVLRSGTPDQKREAVAKIVQAYGVDMSQALPYIDPQVQQYQQEIAQRDQHIQQLSQSQAQREQGELNSHIEQAKQGKEHFDLVRNEMAALLQAGPARDINDAYEMAIWARPDLRQGLLAKQREDSRIEQVNKAKLAKQASAVNVSARGTFPAAKPVLDMTEDIRANYRRLTGQS
jgi:hypothetical protein